MERIEPIATALSTQRDRARGRATRPQVVRGSGGASAHRTTSDDVSLVVCFLALVGVLVLGGVLTLFSWVTSTIACKAPDGCVLTVADDIQPVWPDDRRIDAPNRIP